MKDFFIKEQARLDELMQIAKREGGRRGINKKNTRKFLLGSFWRIFLMANKILYYSAGKIEKKKKKQKKETQDRVIRTDNNTTIFNTVLIQQ